jgi:hypothetical protein
MAVNRSFTKFQKERKRQEDAAAKRRRRDEKRRSTPVGERGAGPPVDFDAKPMDGDGAQMFDIDEEAR